jgi:hypothetical protein
MNGDVRVTLLRRPGGRVRLECRHVDHNGDLELIGIYPDHDAARAAAGPTRRLMAQCSCRPGGGGHEVNHSDPSVAAGGPRADRRKLVPRLASEFEGERIATVAAIDRVLKAAGFDWVRFHARDRDAGIVSSSIATAAAAAAAAVATAAAPEQGVTVTSGRRRHEHRRRDPAYDDRNDARTTTVRRQVGRIFR